MCHQGWQLLLNNRSRFLVKFATSVHTLCVKKELIARGNYHPFRPAQAYGSTLPENYSESFRLGAHQLHDDIFICMRLCRLTERLIERGAEVRENMLRSKRGSSA
eukprot:3301553-Amphidinium_carterae.1